LHARAAFETGLKRPLLEWNRAVPRAPGSHQPATAFEVV
jgi:hypothetical protein